MGSDAQTCLVCHPVDLRRTARYTNRGFIILFTFCRGSAERVTVGVTTPGGVFLPQRDPMTGQVKRCQQWHPRLTEYTTNRNPNSYIRPTVTQSFYLRR